MPREAKRRVSWEDFVERNNYVLSVAEGNELVATWGTQSVANRMLSFPYKRLDGRVPEQGGLDDKDRALLAKVEAGFQTVGELPQERPQVPRRSFGALPSAPLGTVSAGLDRKAPWFQIKEDKATAATIFYVTHSVRVVDNLKTLLAPTPCVPRTAQRLHGYLRYAGQLFGTQQLLEYEEEARSHQALTYDHSRVVGTWAVSTLPPGQALRAPAPLFKKRDESVVEEEYKRLG